MDRGESLLIFDNETGEPIDVDLRGTVRQVLSRVKAREASKGKPDFIIEVTSRLCAQPALDLSCASVERASSLPAISPAWATWIWL